MTISIEYNPTNKLQIISKIIQTMEENPFGNFVFNTNQSDNITIFNKLDNSEITEEILQSIILAKRSPRSDFINI